MVLIQPDPNRRIEIPGVPVPVRRPVDIDQTATGFTSLRTLRIYQFDEGSVIEGHAEEDEVLIIVLAGSIELTMITDPFAAPSPVILSAPGGAGEVACAAYLPPQATYKLTPQGDADVAYARATPSSRRLPKVFHSSSLTNHQGANTLLEETTYAERLGFRLVRFDAQRGKVVFSPVHEAEAKREALVHVRSALPAERFATISEGAMAPIWLDSRDTVAISPGERPTLNFATGTAGLALIVMAS